MFFLSVYLLFGYSSMPVCKIERSQMQTFTSVTLSHFRVSLLFSFPHNLDRSFWERSRILPLTQSLMHIKPKCFQQILHCDCRHLLLS